MVVNQHWKFKPVLHIQAGTPTHTQACKHILTHTHTQTGYLAGFPGARLSSADHFGRTLRLCGYTQIKVRRWPCVFVHPWNNTPHTVQIQQTPTPSDSNWLWRLQAMHILRGTNLYIYIFFFHHSFFLFFFFVPLNLLRLHLVAEKQNFSN